MHPRILCSLVACGLALILPAAAAADYAHVVAPGETLTSVAAVDGLSIGALAAANGISPDSQLIAGSVLEIPPQTAYTQAGTPAVAATPTATAVPVSTSTGGGYVVQPGDTLTAIAARDGTTVSELAALNGLNPDGILLTGAALELPGGSAAATSQYGQSTTATPVSTSTGGGYVVQPGDTLTAIAARDGTTVSELAALNGLNPDGILLIGAALELPGAGSAGAGSQYVSTSSAGTAGAAGSGGPYPTPETVSGPQIAGIAGAGGVPAPLAQAIGWQESGWNNDEVSNTGAVGVMQIEPSTWSWIQNTLTPSSPLSPYSAADNVRGGVLLLHSLLSATGSDAMAAAGYYQGLTSVQNNGMYPDTQQYVNDVLALERQFGGG